ncbi:hypothetical protein CCR75_008353 [Bremia lactucae]|uniref:Uncharacterized protein n=1 Tax=Bremia lactucae TaxID=4779 RepID=A0A976FFB4_BRELC|nr:hypothetical protein CCR75_008353 [Bremia lactucae]
MTNISKPSLSEIRMTQKKAECFRSQEWEALQSNPAYLTLRKYADTAFRTELLNGTPPVSEGIEQ